MPRYIDADKLFAYVDGQAHLSKGRIINFIRENETSDVTQVRHAERLVLDEDERTFVELTHQCLNCFRYLYKDDAYCPGCGAKVDKEHQKEGDVE